MSAAAATWPALVERACLPYRPAGRFALHFARGKLRHDPVFRHLLVHGLIAPHDRVLDIGCGQGLLASLLGAAGGEASGGRWPADWAAAPSGARVTGIDLSPREVARARQALGESADFVCGDMRSTAFPAADAVVILDALHYIGRAEQDAVLARARAALASGGRLVLRVGDATAGRRFAASHWVDRVVSRVRGLTRPGRGRSADEWRARLAGLGFGVASLPMSKGTPFANVLLVGTLAPALAGATPAAAETTCA